MARMILVMLYWVHILGCGFFYVSWQTRSGELGGVHRAWVEEYEEGFAARPETSTLDKYVVAIYWSMGMVTGLEVDVVPENQASASTRSSTTSSARWSRVRDRGRDRRARGRAHAGAARGGCQGVCAVAQAARRLEPA